MKESQIPRDVLAAWILSSLIVGGFMAYGWYNGAPDVGYTALDLVGFGIAGMIWVILGIGRLIESLKGR